MQCVYCGFNKVVDMSSMCGVLTENLRGVVRGRELGFGLG